MRSLAARIFPLLLAAACAAPPTPVAPPVATVAVEAPPPVASAAPAAPLPPLDPSLPASAVGLVSVDLGKLDRLAGDTIRQMDPQDRGRLEGLLRLGGGALADGKLPAALALDTGR